MSMCCKTDPVWMYSNFWCLFLLFWLVYDYVFVQKLNKKSRKRIAALFSTSCFCLGM